MQGWVSLLGSLAVIAIIVTAIGLMVGIVKPAEAMKQFGTILGVVVGLMVVPGILGSIWSAIPLWKWITLVLIGIGIWQWRRPRQQTRNKKND